MARSLRHYLTGPHQPKVPERSEAVVRDLEAKPNGSCKPAVSGLLCPAWPCVWACVALPNRSLMDQGVALSTFGLPRGRPAAPEAGGEVLRCARCSVLVDWLVAAGPLDRGPCGSDGMCCYCCRSRWPAMASTSASMNVADGSRRTTRTRRVSRSFIGVGWLSRRPSRQISPLR